MKRYIVASQERSRKNLENAGFEFYSFEYDEDAQRYQKQLESEGKEVKLLREQTDTPGLKIYSIWFKDKVESEPKKRGRKPVEVNLHQEVDPNIAKYLPKYQQVRLTELYKDEDIDGVSYWWSMDPNPDDDMQEEVSGHSYGLQDLKYDIDAYIKKNMRLGYDY